MKKKLLLCLFCVFSVGVYAQSTLVPTFNIEYKKGNQFSSKPDLRSRINGVREIQLYVPKNSSELDNYIYGNISSYFQTLGLRVDVVSALFDYPTQQVGTVYARHTVFKEDVGDYLKNANTLAAVVNYTRTQGLYVGGTTLHITFVDYVNGYTWNIQGLEVPHKGEKFIKRLKSKITDSYHYDSSFSFVPPSQISTWNESIFREAIGKYGVDAIEGIYESYKYTIGVKKHSNGKYYLLYFDGADNIGDWKDGEVKGILTSTASQSRFKADWLGKWKQNMKATIEFSPAGFIVTFEDGEQESYLKMFPDAQMVR